MPPQFLLLASSFIIKQVLKQIMDFFLISPIVFNALYCKMRIAQTCGNFGDPVTIYYLASHISKVLGTSALHTCATASYSV